MLHRGLLKFEAKGHIFKSGFKIYGYTLFTMLITGIVGSVVSLRLQLDGAETALSYREVMIRLFGKIPSTNTLLLICAAALIYAAFSSIISVGYARVCLMCSRGEEFRFSDIFDGFSYFGRIIAAQLLIGLLTFLGSMLFVIPGIVVALMYSQTFLIMIDDPGLSAIQAMRASRKLMVGHKIEYLVYSFSFLPWMLLTSLIPLVDIWLTPYMGVCNGLYYQHLCGYRSFTFGARPDQTDGENTDE